MKRAHKITALLLLLLIGGVASLSWRSLQASFVRQDFLQAATEGNSEFIRSALARGVSPFERDEAGISALHLAIRSHNHEAAGLLIAAGADPDMVDGTGRTAVEEAIYEMDNPSIITVVACASKNKSLQLEAFKRALLLAVLHNKPNVIRDIDMPSREFDKAMDGVGSPVLIYASKNNHGKMVSELLKAGANPNVTDHQGLTPLIWAMRRGNEGVIKTLVGAGADKAVVRVPQK